MVFQPRIQASPNCTRDAWNHHQIRTAGHHTPIALYELSREQAINQGYWTGDPGDDVANVGDLYGVELEGPIPPVEVQDDATTFVN